MSCFDPTDRDPSPEQLLAVKMPANKEPLETLFEVLAKHFAPGDVEGAKRWMRKWVRDDDQIVIGHETECGYTVRAMAGNVSDYLQGFNGSEPESYNSGNFVYCDTKYGGELYGAAWGDGDENV